jgi:hypothetical protein
VLCCHSLIYRASLSLHPRIPHHSIITHQGAHKINNAVGQALLAKRMGRRKIIAETGAGQHGVATAAVCAHLGTLLQLLYIHCNVTLQQHTATHNTTPHLITQHHHNTNTQHTITHDNTL